jgi:hypothetical protein
MLFYITGGAPQAVLGTACVEANWTACIEVYCSSEAICWINKGFSLKEKGNPSLQLGPGYLFSLL